MRLNDVPDSESIDVDTVSSCELCLVSLVRSEFPIQTFQLTVLAVFSAQILLSAYESSGSTS
jgi:hypothetical protein